ncbi:MAG: acetyltransferase [Paenibacillaceae bacterium]
MRLPVIVIGAGGHARVLIDALRLQSIDILGFTDPNAERKETVFQDVCYLGDDRIIATYPPSEVRLVNAIGSIGSTEQRKKIYEFFKAKSYFFQSVVHPSAVISQDVVLLEGVQIMAGVILQAGSRIGENVIINTKTSVDHDCIIGSHVHLAPGVTLSGGVQVDSGAHVGTGSTVIQWVRIYTNSIVGAGSLVLKNVPPNSTVYGVPAKEVVN